MPLSENEQRQLIDIEQLLHAEAPRLAEFFRTGNPLVLRRDQPLPARLSAPQPPHQPTQSRPIEHPRTIINPRMHLGASLLALCSTAIFIIAELAVRPYLVSELDYFLWLLTGYAVFDFGWLVILTQLARGLRQKTNYERWIPFQKALAFFIAMVGIAIFIPIIL